MPKAFGEGGRISRSCFSRTTRAFRSTRVLRKRGAAQPHDHRDINEAQRVAVTVDPAPMGLIYQNPDVPTYEEIRWETQERLDHKTFVERLDAAMDRYAVEAISARHERAASPTVEDVWRHHCAALDDALSEAIRRAEATFSTWTSIIATDTMLSSSSKRLDRLLRLASTSAPCPGFSPRARIRE